MSKLLNILGGIFGIILIATGISFMVLTNYKITYEPNILKDTKVQFVKAGRSNVYFIESNNGYILVDTSMPSKAKKFDEVLASIEIAPTDIELIIATHGHMDHIGQLAYAKKISGAPILAHRSIAEHLKNGVPEVTFAQSYYGKFLNFMTSILDALGQIDIERVNADILMEDEFDLNEYGVAGHVIHTPGHSAGSVSIILDNGEAMISSLVRDEGAGIIGLGRFYSSKEDIITSIQRIINEDSITIYLSHGKWIGVEQLELVLERISK